jgi:hypothetical protein
MTSAWPVVCPGPLRGRKLADATASQSDGSIYASESEALQSAEIDILIDYISAAAVKENVERGGMLLSARAGSVPATMPSSTVSPATGVWVWLQRATSRSWLPS